MSDFVSTVRQKLDEHSDLSPVGKVINIVQIRTFFSQCTIQEGLDLINSISDIKQLQILIGVGMKGVFWSEIGKKMSEMYEI